MTLLDFWQKDQPTQSPPSFPPANSSVPTAIATSTQFERVIQRVLDHEGGYVFHPRDPGGETKYGISKRSYPDVDIKNLTYEQAKGLYFRDFWKPISLEALDPATQYQMLDSAVNHGAGNTIRMLQRAVGVADDGDWGPRSKQAMSRTPKEDLALVFLAERLDFMTNLSRFDTFGRGWSRRIAQNIRYIAEDN